MVYTRYIKYKPYRKTKKSIENMSVTYHEESYSMMTMKFTSQIRIFKFVNYILSWNFGHTRRERFEHDWSLLAFLSKSNGSYSLTKCLYADLVQIFTLQRYKISSTPVHCAKNRQKFLVYPIKIRNFVLQLFFT